jgi:predicted glycosyltransferase
MDQRENTTKGKVLVAPLDWGLGHATRCMPIINTLLQKSCTVLLAGEGKTKILLQKEFPELTFLDLKGYDVQYSREKWWLPFHMAGQIPKILAAIDAENEWLKDVVQTHQIDAVISDNRYGLHHEKIHSVFVTHQLLIKTGFGKWADEILQSENYEYINRFDECWVPDVKEEANLGGNLSHPENLPRVPVKYIGNLSRFTSRKTVSGDKHLLIILSGPEPQRTIFEDQLQEQLKDYTQPAILVRGLPGSDETLDLPTNIKVYNHLDAKELEAVINDADYVISRCGYSTVMDLAALQKRSILIPTPGQTEQEYLARYLMQKNFAFCIDQDKFRLKASLELATAFPYRFDEYNSFHLQDAIDDLLLKLTHSSTIR